MTGYASSPLGNLGATTGFQVFSNNIVVADSSVGPTESEIETYLGATEVFQTGATNDAVYIAADNGFDTFIFLITEGDDSGGPDKQFDAAADTALALIRLVGMADATTLGVANLEIFS